MIVVSGYPDRRFVVLGLEDVVIVKPHRGGVAFWRWIKDFLRVEMHRVTRIEFTSKKSIYIFPARPFETSFRELSENARFLDSVEHGNAAWIYVRESMVVAPRDRVREHIVVVERDAFGAKKFEVDGKQMVKEPQWSTASLSEDLWSLGSLSGEEDVEEEGNG